MIRRNEVVSECQSCHSLASFLNDIAVLRALLRRSHCCPHGWCLPRPPRNPLVELMVAPECPCRSYLGTVIEEKWELGNLLWGFACIYLYPDSCFLACLWGRKSWWIQMGWGAWDSAASIPVCLGRWWSCRTNSEHWINAVNPRALYLGFEIISRH